MKKLLIAVSIFLALTTNTFAQTFYNENPPKWTWVEKTQVWCLQWGGGQARILSCQSEYSMPTDTILEFRNQVNRKSNEPLWNPNTRKWEEMPKRD